MLSPYDAILEFLNVLHVIAFALLILDLVLIAGLIGFGVLRIVEIRQRRRRPTPVDPSCQEFVVRPETFYSLGGANSASHSPPSTPCSYEWN
jgi:hypothetical protein